MVMAPGTSCQTSTPATVAHRIAVYRNGETSPASPSRSASIIRKCAPAFSRPFTSSQAEAVTVSARQPRGMVKSATATMRVDAQNRREIDVSVRDRRRVITSRSPLTTAAATGMSSTQRKSTPPGRMIASTPAKPIRTAIQRNQETRSPSRCMEKIRTTMGDENTIAVTVAIGKLPSAQTISAAPPTWRIARNA